MENIVEFKNRDGQMLRGILHEPGQTSRNSTTAVIILNPGIDDRIGPHRLNVKIARRLCKEGFYVLRFDYPGLGISDGDLKKAPNTEHFLSIEKGMYIGDTLAAVDFMKRRTGATRMIVAGLCGGGMTGLMAGSRCNDIAGVAVIDPVIYIRSAERSGAIPIEVKVVSENLSKKLLQWGTWRKLLSFRFDMQYLTKMLCLYARVKLADATGHPEKTVLGHTLNGLLVESFLQYVRTKRQILFILGDKDLAAAEFKYNFQDRYITPAAASCCSVVNIAGANHEFHSLTAQRMLLDELSGWAARQSVDRSSGICYGIR